MRKLSVHLPTIPSRRRGSVFSFFSEIYNFWVGGDVRKYPQRATTLTISQNEPTKNNITERATLLHKEADQSTSTTAERTMSAISRYHSLTATDRCWSDIEAGARAEDVLPINPSIAEGIDPIAARARIDHLTGEMPPISRSMRRRQERGSQPELHPTADRCR